MTSIHRGRDLSVEEIRYWIVRKRNVTRRRRLEHFWKTGRVLLPSGEPQATPDIPARSERRATTWIDRVLLGAEVNAVLNEARKAPDG